MPNIVRDGHKSWPTCPKCGCRLDIRPMEEWTNMFHFGEPDIKKDARGCECPLVEKHFWIETEKLSHILGVN